MVVKLEKWKEQDLMPGAPRPREERESQGLGTQVKGLAQADDREGGIGKQVSALAHERNDARKLAKWGEAGPGEKDPKTIPAKQLGQAGNRDAEETMRDLNAAVKEFILKNDAHWEKAMAGQAGPAEYAAVGKDILDFIKPGPRLGAAAMKIGMDTFFPETKAADQGRTRANAAASNEYHGSIVDRILERLSK